MRHDTPSASLSVRFGPFRLDAGARVLYRDGQPVPLTPKQVQTLVVLVRAAGDVVERERLMREVWPDTFVEDAGLTRNISALRKALGDSADGGAFIETVPKRGYRFVAAIAADAPPGAATATPSSDPVTPASRADAPRPSSPRRGWVFATTAAVLVALVSVAIWLSRPAPAPAVSGAPQTIVVLPFRLISTDQRDQHLAYGLSDLLTTKLGALRTMVVRPIATAAAARVDDPVETGRRLGVDAVIDGTLRRSGDRLRLTVQVIEVATGAPLYAGTFDERGNDLLSLESALADGVLSLLVPRVRDAEQTGRARAGTANVTALEQYLLGRYLLATRQPARVEDAIAAFEAAIAADDGFALAHASLAHAYIVQGGYQYRRPSDVFPKARIAALRALDLDPGLAEAEGALGEASWQYDWNWAAAEQAHDRAIELAPHEPTFRHWRAFHLGAMGRASDAIAEIERAVQLAPRDFTVNFVRAALHYWAHRFDEVPAHADRAAALGGHSPAPLLYKQFALYRLGRIDEARAVFDTVRAAAPDDPMVQGIFALHEWRAGRTGEALALLADLEAQRHAGGRYIDAYPFASAYAEIGDSARAFQWLEQAVEDRSAYVPMLAVDPFWTHLHGDARFLGVIERVGLGEALARVSGRRAE